MKKRFWVAPLLAVSMLTACSSQGNTETGSTPAPSGGKETQSAKPHLDLKFFIDSPANSKLPAEDVDFVKKTIESKFNVSLTMDYMGLSEDYNKKINVLLTSNDPPDVWRDANSDGGQKYALDGLLGDISKFVTPATMPNYFKYWIDEATLKTYKIHNMNVRAPIPYNKEIYRAWYIRKDWLDKLKLPVPKTYDEYLTAIRAFANNDPDGNGKKDTFGFTTFGSGTSIGLDWPEYIKNGLTYSTFIENNKYIDSQTDPRNKQVLDDIVKVIQEGLVDPDWFLNKNPQHVDKAAQGKVGVVLGTAKDFAYDSNPQSLQSKSKQLFPEANWVPFSPFGATPVQSGIAPGSPFLFHKNVLEKEPEKVQRVTEILDWLAGEEGFLLTHYGQEGKHYTRSGSKITINPQAFEEDIVKKGNWLAIWDFFTPDTPAAFKLEVVDPRQTDRDREITKIVAAIPTAPYVGTSLTPPQGFDLAAFRTRQRQLQVQAVLEDKSGKNWPAYLDELLTKYKGNDLFNAYTEQIKAAGIIK